MVQYFSHDVGAQNDDKCIRLIRELGYEGYGVFWALIERMSGCEACSLAYKPSDLAWSMHVDEKILVRVIKDFGFFVFSEDGTTFWSESARRRRESGGSRYKKQQTQAEDAPKRKRGRPRKNPLPDEPLLVEEQQATSEVKETPSAEPVEETPAVIENTEQPFDEEEDYSQPNQGEEIIELWNSIFEGTRRTYKGLCLDALSYQRMNESYTSGFTIEDFEKAFKVARADNFCWLLRDVLKAENIQRLLSKEEKQHELQNNSNNNPAPTWELPADLQTATWNGQTYGRSGTGRAA